MVNESDRRAQRQQFEVPIRPPHQTDLRAPGTKTKPASQQAARQAFHGPQEAATGGHELLI